MIKCTKCGADNMMNAIFCRSCGEKLNLEDLKLENQLDDIDDKKGDSSKLANQIVGGVLAFVLVVGLAMLLIPTTGALSPEEPSSDATKLRKEMTNPKADDRVSISDQDLTNLINKALELPKKGEDTIQPKSFSISAHEDGIVKVTMVSTVFGFLPINANFTAKVTFTGKGSFEFLEPSGTKLGWIPFLPPAATAPFVDPFKSAAQNNPTINNCKRNITGVAIAEGQFLFDVEKKVTKKKGRKKAKGGKAAAPKKAAPPVALPF